MAVGLLLSAFAKSYSKEELYLQQKFKERLADLQATVGECLHPRLFEKHTAKTDLSDVSQKKSLTRKI